VAMKKFVPQLCFLLGIAAVFLLPVSLDSASLEIIDSFVSTIKINVDAAMQVEEKIIYTNHGVLGLHGITRDFPTNYKDRWGNNVMVGFHVHEVLRDGHPVPYRVVPYTNGKRIYIGDAQKVVPPGTYVYTIRYATHRQLGFFDDHDELYWNVTGNGSKFPIRQAHARVMLPGVKAQDIALEAYTGYQGQRGTNYQARILPDGISTFATTGPLLPGQGLTIVVSWPKGYVTAPTLMTNIGYFLDDNKGVLWLLIGLIVLLLLYIRSYVHFRREQRRLAGTIIPRFYPPAELTPSEVRYIYRKSFDTQGFAAEIVYMAVQGFLTIDCREGKFFQGSRYALIAKNVSTDKQPVLHAGLYQRLFSKHTKLDLCPENNTIITSALEMLKSCLVRGYNAKCFNFNYAPLITGGAIAVFFAVVGMTFIPETSDSAVAWLLVAFYVLATVLFGYAVHGYTRDGMKLYEEIEGFKLFLAITETERLKIVGTPPTKTPELYETYLPYAMALGVEQAWSAQFAPLFAQFAQEGHPYVPLWYMSSYPFYAHGFSDLSSQLSGAVSAATNISSSSTPPGSSSGSGGRGSSGGGGAGGGTGSW
jgi:uncharacterized membrane protein YgcG